MIRRFGNHFRLFLNDNLRPRTVPEGLIFLKEKGALDCVTRARLQSALLRAADEPTLNWGALK